MSFNEADRLRHLRMVEDYERHGGDDDTWVQGAEPNREFTLVGWLAFGFVAVLCCLVLWVLLSSKAQAQTAQAILVRACPTTPAVTGFGACSNSVWAVPGPTLVLDIQRNNIDMWLTPSQLMTGDKVFACEDPSIVAGPFKSCPSFLPNQQNNYLLASTVNFGNTSPPPPTTNGTLKLTWTAPTQDSLNNPVTQSLSYQLFTRENDCSTPGPQCQPDYVGTGGPQGLRPPAADVPTTSASLSLAPGNYCAIVMAYFTGFPNTLGAPPLQEWCGTVGAGLVTPGRVTNIQQVTP